MECSCWRGKEGRMEIWIEPEKLLCLMLATFALEWRSNYPLVFGASVPRSQKPLGPCRQWASRASCLPNTCRYPGQANSPTTREADERAGNCCQKPRKVFFMKTGERCRRVVAADLHLNLPTWLRLQIGRIAWKWWLSLLKCWTLHISNSHASLGFFNFTLTF